MKFLKQSAVCLIMSIFVFTCFAVADVSAMEYNTDRRGSDYRSFKLDVPDPVACQSACRNEPQCKAWTYVNPGVQGPQARCWLKNRIPGPTQSACCTSGVERPDTVGQGSSAGAGAGAASGWETNIDRRGSDYRSFKLASPDPGACQNACRNEGQCKAWTYVNPGVQGPEARCWLKNRIPGPTQSTCCTSGVERPDTVGQGSSAGAGAGVATNWERNIDRRGKDYRSFKLDAPDPGVCQNACRNEGQCRAWTYVNPGVQGPQARCWLKNSVPSQISSTCCISGVER